MIKPFFCIICPNGCDIEAEIVDGEVLSLEGSRCPKGRDYVIQELCRPTRNIATSVPVIGGDMPLCSVRLSKPIPKDKIFEAMDEIKKIQAQAPVKIGQVIAPDILGLESDVLATRHVYRASQT